MQNIVNQSFNRKRQIEPAHKSYHRPRSSNPQQRQNTRIEHTMEPDYKTNHIKRDFDNDRTLYKKYDVAKVVDARHKLLDYYEDKKTLNYSRGQEPTNPKFQPPVLPVQKPVLDNTAQHARDDLIYNKYNQDLVTQPIIYNQYDKPVALEPEYKQIDFYQLDQFSPPNNISNNIAYNMPDRHEQPTDQGLAYVTEYKRKENLNLLKQYADSIGTTKLNQEKYSSYGSYTGRELNYDYTQNERQKLDHQSRSYLKDRINSIKVDSNTGTNIYKKIRPEY